MSMSKTIDNYLESSSELADLLATNVKEVEDLTLVLTDLDHFLELEDLSGSDETNLIALRKHTLTERRKAKDYVRVIDQILPKQIEGRTTQDRYEFAIRNLNDRVYTPRKISLEDVTGESQ